MQSRLSCLSLLLALPLAAQAASPWVDLHVPTGVLPSGVQADGRLVVYRNGTFLRASRPQPTSGTRCLSVLALRRSC